MPHEHMHSSIPNHGTPQRRGQWLASPRAAPSCLAGTSDPSPFQRGAPESALLFTASKDAVAAWNLASVYAALADNLPLAPPIQVMANPGACDALVFSGELGYLVVCAGNDVHVFDTRTFRHVYRWGHGQSRASSVCCRSSSTCPCQHSRGALLGGMCSPTPCGHMPCPVSIWIGRVDDMGHLDHAAHPQNAPAGDIASMHACMQAGGPCSARPRSSLLRRAAREPAGHCGRGPHIQGGWGATTQALLQRRRARTHAKQLACIKD